MSYLTTQGFIEPLKEYIRSNKHFLGICLGMQVFFEGSEESEGVAGLGIVKGMITKFKFEDDVKLSVPSIGWNGVKPVKASPLLSAIREDDKVYFVHSFHASESRDNAEWVLSKTNYGIEYVSSIGRGNVYATQFHPEKSGTIGLTIIKAFLDNATGAPGTTIHTTPYIASPSSATTTTMAKRVIACLDVRSNDMGDLVVTKGDQYDVREEERKGEAKGEVRNLGKPVDLARRYYEEGADEITFLNITSFRYSEFIHGPLSTTFFSPPFLSLKAWLCADDAYDLKYHIIFYFSR